MDRLSQFLWQGKPLTRFVQRGNGQDAWSLVEDVTGSTNTNGQPDLSHRKPEPAHQDSTTELREPQQPRSRAGESPPEVLPHRLRGRLLELGVEESRADSLIAEQDPERVQRQLDWLPYRNANNPGRFIVAAIQKDYEAPLALRGKGGRNH